MSEPDFIEVYPDALERASCAATIDYFNRCGQAVRGSTGSGVDLALKDSWDIKISGRPDWQPLHDAIQRAAFAGFRRYVRRYPHAILAPLALKQPDPGGQLRPLDVAGLAALSDAALDPLLQRCFRPGYINVQKYLADQGGYPYWHCEQYPMGAEAEPLHRVLLYTIYLNDGFADGETEFLHQRRKIVPQTGALLLAPTAFTHTHRGNRPRGGDKYIATSWILFERAEKLYGAG